MEFLKKHILSTGQFDRNGIEIVIKGAKSLEKFAVHGEKTDLLKGKILATLFFEPSTRTRFSFETAMLRLGGDVIVNHSMLTSSSIKKGESLSDTGQMVSRFADVIVMRHSEAGAVAELAKGSLVPVINAGDGSADHPTQGLLDIYTIQKEKGTIDGLTVGIVGDLKNSRVLHSQVRLLSNFDVNLILVSPNELQLPDDLIEELKLKNINYEFTESVKDAISEMDIISTNRIQEERFSDPIEFERFRRSFIFDVELLKFAKKDAILINPLPRVDEINPEIDSDSRCKYFEQVSNGIAVRMALLTLVLGVKST